MNNTEIEQRFQRRNIANCLSIIFPIAFTPEENSAIAHEVLRLMNLLNKDFKTVFDEFEFLITKAKHHCSVESATLNNLLFKIRKNGKLKTHYVPAFICSELQMVSYNQEQFVQYKALTLIACVRLMMMGEHDSAVKNVCTGSCYCYDVECFYISGVVFFSLPAFICQGYLFQLCYCRINIIIQIKR